MHLTIHAHGFLAVMKKELTSVLRDRTIVIAILIQLFIASFSSALLIGMLSLYDPDSAGIYANVQIDVALIGKDADLNSYLSARGIRALPYSTLEQAEVDFQQGKVRAILVLPEQRDDLINMKLYLPHEEAVASIILNLLQEPLRRYENTLRGARGIAVRYTDLKGSPPTQFEFIYSAILPILMLFPAFVGGGMVVDSISEEVENNTLDTLLSAPLSLNTAMGAKIAAALLLAIVQCIAWLGLLELNGVVIRHFGLVLTLAILTAGIVTVGAAIITVLFRDRERSQFVYSLALLVAASASFLLGISPIRTLARLAIGDYYTGGMDVLVIAGVLAVLIFLFFRATRQLKI
jgi:ABC-2 type transport system permease protein